MVTFARASDNNEAGTVRQLFVDAVRVLGCPSKVRVDWGGENNGMAWVLEQLKGENRTIRGRSVNNQKIERFWCDFSANVIEEYKNLFDRLVIEFGMNPENILVRYSLHYTFLPRINEKIDVFVAGWNNHSMRCRGHKGLWTPLQLAHLNGDVSYATPVTEGELNAIGIAPEGYGPHDQVVTHSTICPLTADQLAQLEAQVPRATLADTLPQCVVLFQRTLACVTRLVQP
jgi:hypothetical protein